MIDQNFEQIFSHTYPKNYWAIVLKLSSLIHSPLKVERFELLVNRSNIVCFKINKGTRCKIYITHLMINYGACEGP